MIDYDLLYKELDALHKNGMKFFKNYSAQEYIELAEFLEERQYELGYKLTIHRESMSGKREIDVIYIKKLI